MIITNRTILTYYSYSATLLRLKCRTFFKYHIPTKKKRVGFIPREGVMKILDKLSFENNLSNSKIISILVEEALSQRGLYNIETGMEKHLYLKDNKNIESVSINSLEDNNSISKAQLDSSKRIFNSQKNNQTFDLKTYEKFLAFLKFQEMLNRYEK